MSDPMTTKIAAHRNNIERYRRLLRTRLTDIERQWLRRRLAEERAELQALGIADLQQAIPEQRTRIRKPWASVPPHIIAATKGLCGDPGSGPLHSG